MSTFFGKLKTGANKVAFEAEKLTRVNKAQGEADKIKFQITSQYTKLGELIYEKFSKQEAIDPALAETCQAIAQMHQQFGLKNDEVAKIKAEVFNPASDAPAPAPAAAAPVAPAPQPEVKRCPNCGKEVGAEEKFCKDCGTKL